ncbi:MAG: bifunctional adenosylcobinamide kinase/adenosylcobinamide-phosphate guanylyltransferase [Gammaproteobacteria bacterium]|nr:bifunctional adenosylcobinamide kinase/adenosylcobinamide-phosphate guanylyltransferase [Gammaproteobacteria bacterium]
MKELILGGARSGKSRLAESRALSIFNKQQSHCKKIIYVATATAYDDEMAERIKHHQQARSDHWHLIEEPIELAKILQENHQEDTLILIECLTLWLTNLLCHSDKTLLATEKQKFIEQLKFSQAEIILVSNETGMGFVPMGELSRRYVDEAGFLHQDLAQISDRVTLVVAGLEQTLKSPNN